jgi:hypothetical protein
MDVIEVYRQLKCNMKTGKWRKLHNEELHMLYSYPNIIRQIESRRMRWAGRVAHMGEETIVYSGRKIASSFVGC